MTADSESTQSSRLVRIVGSSPGAAELSGQLRNLGLVVSTEPGTTDPSLTLFTGTQGLECLSETIPLGVTIDRHLGESDWVDTRRQRSALELIRPARPPHTESPGHSEEGFTVTFEQISGRNLGVGPDQVAIVTELGWNEAASEPSLTYLTGEHLDEFQAVASAASGLGVVSLALVVPMQVVVDHSVAVVDILWRLLDHPGARSLIPSRDADWVSESLVRTRHRPATTRYSANHLELDRVVDPQNHRDIGAEFQGVRSASRMIQDAAFGNRWTGANFSRIVRG